MEFETVIALVQLWQEPNRWGLLPSLMEKWARANEEGNTLCADKRRADELDFGDPDFPERAAANRRADSEIYLAELLKLWGELRAIEAFCRDDFPAALRMVPIQPPVDSPPTDGYDRLAQAMRQVEAELRIWRATQPTGRSALTPSSERDILATMFAKIGHDNKLLAVCAALINDEDRPQEERKGLRQICREIEHKDPKKAPALEKRWRRSRERIFPRRVGNVTCRRGHTGGHASSASVAAG